MLPADRLTAICAGKSVAYVCSDPGIGVFGTKGASVHVQAVIRVLRAAGARVSLFAAKTGGSAPADLADLPVHALPTSPKGDPAARERALMSADDEIAAIVAGAGPFDLYYERYSLFSAAAAQWAANTGARVVVEVNAPLIDEHAEHRGLVHRTAAELSLKRLLSAADTAACVSEPVRSWVIGHDPTAPAIAVANGADVHRITPAADPRTGPVTIGFVGTLKPWHGVDQLLTAAADLQALPTPPALLIVGDGPLGEHIDHRAGELDLPIERTGAVDPARVPALLRRMDIGVAPYPADADQYFSPLKVLEYLAAGLPVVASAVGQLPSLIDHESTGLLVPPSDTTALSGALRRLIDDPVLRHRCGQRARQVAVARHSWERTVVATVEHAVSMTGTAA